jgi:hypothetical protein
MLFAYLTIDVHCTQPPKLGAAKPTFAGLSRVSARHP